MMAPLIPSSTKNQKKKKKRFQSWTPSDKTFWNRAWYASPCSCVDWFENYLTANLEDSFFASGPNYTFCLLTMTSLTLCMLSNFSCLFCRLLMYFINNFFENTFSNTVRVSNILGPDKPDVLSGLIRVQTVCKCYQQTTVEHLV